MCLITAAALPGAALARIEVQDAEGRSVVLNAPAQRIVSLAPHLTELLFAAGAGDHVTGTVAHADHPPAARAIRRVGDAALLDLEQVAALRPDLIVVWREGTSPQQLERLAALRVPMFAAESPTLESIGALLRTLGVLAGTSDMAARRAAAFDAELAALRAQFGKRPTLRVFYQIWPQPLMTINGKHLISQALNLCGAHNVFAAQPTLTPTVTEEAVLLADPDALVAAQVEGVGAAVWQRWQRLAALRAARLNHLMLVNPDWLHRPSDRMVLGVRQLCEKLDGLRPAR